MKTSFIVAGFIIFILAVLFGLGMVNTQNSGNDQENNIINAVGQCKVVENEEMKKVLDLMVVKDSGHSYIQDIINSLASEHPSKEAQQVKGEYEKLLSGQSTSSQGLVGVLTTAGVISATDFLSLDKQVMNAVEAGRNRLRDCKQMLLEQQNNYRKAIGMDASGRLSSFPNGMFANVLSFPHEISSLARTRPEKDWDGDGRITVLDYQPPVLPEIQSKWNDGEDTSNGWTK